MLELSYNIRHPSKYRYLIYLLSFFTCRFLSLSIFFLILAVPLKTELSYEVLEKGHVRFWLQAKKLSSAASYRFIVNDKEVTSAEVQSMSCAVLDS